MIKIFDELPENYPNKLPAEGTPPALRMRLVFSPLARFCRVSMASVAQNPLAVPDLLSRSSEWGFTAVFLMALVAGSAEIGDALSASEVAAVVLMPVLLTRAGFRKGAFSWALQAAPPTHPIGQSPSKRDKQRLAEFYLSAVDRRCVVVAARYQRLAREVFNIWRLAGLTDPPSCLALFDGPLFKWLFDACANISFPATALTPSTLIGTLAGCGPLWEYLVREANLIQVPLDMGSVIAGIEELTTLVAQPLGGVIPDPALWRRKAPLDQLGSVAIGVDADYDPTTHDPEAAEVDILDTAEDDGENGDAEDGRGAAGEEPLLEAHKNKLPILEFRDKIIKEIATHRVVVIQGETGSGKSSQVPQFIVQEFEEDQRAPSAKRAGIIQPFVLVTQPRRIAAVTLAKRVASERGEVLGDSVGFAIGNEAVGGRNGRPLLIQFVTGGWLLQKLLHNRAYFSKCTHIVLDEVHERSIDSDLLYLLVRQLLATLPCSTRIVLMSATFNTGLFVDYFASAVEDAVRVSAGLIAPDKSLRDVPSMFVGVKRYPVEVVHLEDIAKHPLFSVRGVPLGLARLQRMAEGFRQINPTAPYSLDSKIEADLAALAVYMCGALADQHSSDPTGNCVLVFLPGIAQIDEMHESILELIKVSAFASRVDSAGRGGHAIEVIVLHSMMEDSEQLRAFEPIPRGTTRVVLATNIAESSVTIPDVRYVIDFGVVRQLHHDPKDKMTMLATMWIPKSSALQRGGRCGRLCPGTVFRMYSKSFFDSLPITEVPEMLRLSLASTVLRLKVILNTYIHTHTHTP